VLMQLVDLHRQFYRQHKFAKLHATVVRGRFVVQGSVLVGPGLHFWYSFIGRTVTATGTAGKLPTCNKAIMTPDP